MDWLKSLLSLFANLFSPVPSAPLASPKKVEVVFPKLSPTGYTIRLKAEAEKKGKMPDDYTPEADYAKPYGYDALIGPGGKIEATYCNYFTRTVCRWFGWTEFRHEDDDQASEICRYMRSHAEYWMKLEGNFSYTIMGSNQQVVRLGPDYEAAVKYACRGGLVVAAQENPDNKAHGHVCIIAPEPKLLVSPKWGRSVPIAANVGKTNFYGQALSWAFALEPELYLYRGGRPA